VAMELAFQGHANASVVGTARHVIRCLAQGIAVLVALALWGHVLALPTSMVQLVRMHGAPEIAMVMASAGMASASASGALAIKIADQ